VQGKEHTQIKKSSNPETKKKKKKNKTEILSLQKFKRVYSGFIPLDLTEMVVSWENKTFSSETKGVPN
jgi:hypothetical protein